MPTTVLLLGRKNIAIDGAERQLQMPDVRLFSATRLDGVRSAFAQADFDHVIMGAGFELEDRLDIIRYIFLTSDTTTVHMKDTASGPGGFASFVRSVLTGLADPNP